MGDLTKSQQAEVEHLYGCTIELNDDEEPDGCVLDYGAPGDCIHAAQRKTKWTCPHWELRSKFLASRAALSETQDARAGEERS